MVSCICLRAFLIIAKGRPVLPHSTTIKKEKPFSPSLLRKKKKEDLENTVCQDPLFGSSLLFFITASAKGNVYNEEKIILHIHQLPVYYLLFIAACAAANLAIGTLNGEQDT